MSSKTIIWDIDGVLIWNHPSDPSRDWRRTLQETNLLAIWEAFQRSLYWELCIRNYEIDTRERFQNFLKNTGIYLHEDTDYIIHIWLERNIEPSFPALEKIYELLALGHDCAIATNQDSLRKPHIEHWLFRRDLDTLPRFVSCDMKLAKPDPLFYIHVQNTLGKDPDDLLLLDDNEQNINNALAAGWQAILIDDSYRLFPEKWRSLPLYEDYCGTFFGSTLLTG